MFVDVSGRKAWMLWIKMKKEEGRERDGCLGVVGMMGRGASSPLRHPLYATLPSNTAFSGIILVLGHARGAWILLLCSHHSGALLGWTRLVPWLRAGLGTSLFSYPFAA